jgi:hypothetical protein
MIPRHVSKDQVVINWIAPPLTNGWANFSLTSVNHKVAYTKDPLGFVHLRGLASRAAGTSTLPLFQLPRGYRPGATERFSVPILTAALAFTTGHLTIDKDGFVAVGAGDGSAYTGLSGVTFRAER